jgi:hypothetical protein
MCLFHQINAQKEITIFLLVMSIVMLKITMKLAMPMGEGRRLHDKMDSKRLMIIVNANLLSLGGLRDGHRCIALIC